MRMEDLDTPAVVIDRAIAEANLRRAQAYADEHGLPLRPHIKTHKLPYFARRQVEPGAIGITCQKIGEAEVMADAGLDEIFITYNILGAQKLERLMRLHGRSRISVMADSALTSTAMRRLSTKPITRCRSWSSATPARSVAASRPLRRRWTWRAHRCGARPALRRADDLSAARRRRKSTAGCLRPPGGSRRRAGGARISNGGTPDLYSAARVTSVTEHAPAPTSIPTACRWLWPRRQGRLRADRARHRRQPPDCRPRHDRCGSKALAGDPAPRPAMATSWPIPER